MRISELVTRHAEDKARPSAAIVVRPSAEALAPMLVGGLVVQSWDESSQELGARTFVEIVKPGMEDEQVSELATVLGETDVALLLFSQPPELLPVGVVTDTLSRHQLTVLEGCGTSHRGGRTVLAVSGDSKRQQRAYLSGTPIPDNDLSRLRQRNEWVVEGMQQRSRLELLGRRLAGQEAELTQVRTECRELEQELTDARALAARVTALEGELAAAQAALATSQRGLARARRDLANVKSPIPQSPIRKAAGLLLDDPKQGSRRIMRGLRRRLRR